jgi:hypothetical protein
MRLGRVIVYSESYSTVHGEFNGLFCEEYLVDLDDKEMVEQYCEYASQQAWDHAIEKAMKEMKFFECSSYPDNDCKFSAQKTEITADLNMTRNRLNDPKNASKKFLMKKENMKSHMDADTHQKIHQSNEH